MDKFLETYSPPKLIQGEIDNLNRPITKSEIESVIKTTTTTTTTKKPHFQQTKAQGQMASQANSIKHLENS